MIDYYQIATDRAEEAVKPLMWGDDKELAIGLYVAEQWKMVIPCQGMTEERYQALVSDIREVVREAVFKALCLVESGSSSTLELGNKVENFNTNGDERND